MDVDKDNFFSADSETEVESSSGLLSEDDAATSDPEVAELTERAARRDAGRKKTNLFLSCFPTADSSSASASGAQSGRQMYRVYGWRWLMLIALFLLNVSNGTVSSKLRIWQRHAK